jgi:hypothetical protein
MPGAGCWRSERVLDAGQRHRPRAGLLAVIVLLLASCDDAPQPVSGLQFARVWQDSYADAAVTWWYVGEDAEYFYLEQRRADGAAPYMVPKSFIVISGIARTAGGKPPAPVRLSRDNLEFM